MGPRHHFKAWLLLFFALTLVGACEQPRSYPVPPSYYYVVPTSTFLRSCASYGEECYVVAQVFSGDRVTVLDRTDYNWARVQLERSGVVGWLPGELLSPSPVPSGFYVAWTNVYLRDCADYNCRPLELLHRGDRVDKIDQDYRGWWRVRSAKSRTTGWIPASAAGPSPGPPYYYVAVSSLALRAGPSTGNRILTTMNLNDRVEMLDMSAGGWARVRDLRTGIIGWSAARYLESFPVSRPRPAPRKHAPSKKTAPPEEAPPPPKVKPKAM